MDINPQPKGLPRSSTNRALTRLGLRLKTPRPVISAPIGPIKNSRGPDFSRSETFTIVDAINDCVLPSPVSPSKKKTEKARNISAGFPRESSLASKPTVARSDVTAMTAAAKPLSRKTTNHVRRTSLSASPKLPSYPVLKTSSTVALLPLNDSLHKHHDENTPPGSGVAKPKPTVIQSKIPKSRTMSVLHDLKTSLSRPSLTSKASATSQTSATDSPPSSTSNNSARIPSSASRLCFLGHSQTSLSPSSTSCASEPDPLLIHTAQPSAYWSGRFMSLYDKFSAETLAPPIPPGSATKKATYKHNGFSQTSASLSAGLTMSKTAHQPGRLTHATTTSALTDIACTSMTALANEEDERIRRVFRHLEYQCTTQEARSSLHEWQLAYARRYNRPHLLPPVREVEARGVISKWFGGAQKSGKRSLSALREVSATHAVKQSAVKRPAHERAHATIY